MTFWKRRAMLCNVLSQTFIVKSLKITSFIAKIKGKSLSLHILYQNVLFSVHIYHPIWAFYFEWCLKKSELSRSQWKRCDQHDLGNRILRTFFPLWAFCYYSLVTAKKCTDSAQFPHHLLTKCSSTISSAQIYRCSRVHKRRNACFPWALAACHTQAQSPDPWPIHGHCPW